MGTLDAASFKMTEGTSQVHDAPGLLLYLDLLLPFQSGFRFSVLPTEDLFAYESSSHNAADRHACEQNP